MESSSQSMCPPTFVFDDMKPNESPETVGQLLDDIRDRYLKEFRECMAYVKQKGMEVMSEAAFTDEDGALVREGTLNLPMRLDVVGLADGEGKDNICVDSITMLSFEPSDFEWTDGLPIRLAPFTWDVCDIRAFGIPETSDWSHLRGWFDHWFDGEDTRQADEQGLFGVIHSVSDPKHEGNATIIQVDFGSAPVEAFEELLDALHDSGATKVEIGHELDG
jgi:hypothetical protein